MIQLQIETSSTCNARCGFCVYSTSGRAAKIMPIALYEKIVTEAATKPSITVLCLNGLNDPIADPLLVERVALARRLRQDWWIFFHTNGFALTLDKFLKLKEAGLSFISISLNALDAEQHARAMGVRGKFEHVTKVAETVIASRGPVGVNVTAVCDYKNFTEDHARAFAKRWGHYEMDDGFGKCISIGNWSGDIESPRTFKPNEWCMRATGQIYVTHDGKVTTCCFDPLGKQVFGDLNTQTLAGIYAGEEYVKFREAHSENRADEYEVCKVCTRI